jgi:hypothetical protein
VPLSRRWLVVLYAASFPVVYLVALLPGGFSVGGLDWWGVALFALLLWFLDRGSRIAWYIAVATTIWTVLSLGFIAPGLDFESATLVVVLVFQLLVLFAPALRTHSSSPEGAHGAH